MTNTRKGLPTIAIAILCAVLLVFSDVISGFEVRNARLHWRYRSNEGYFVVLDNVVFKIS